MELTTRTGILPRLLADVRESLMRKLAIVATSAALLALPAFALAASPMTDLSSQGVGVEIGPGGVRVGETPRRARGGPDCRELRAACLNKERLGEQGEGNCRRYRRLCR
jgi:hypothetical protein